MAHLIIGTDKNTGKYVVREEQLLERAVKLAERLKEGTVIPFEEVATSNPTTFARDAYNTPPLLEMTGRKYRLIKFYSDPQDAAAEGMGFWSHNRKKNAAVNEPYEEEGKCIRKEWMAKAVKVVARLGMPVEYAYCKSGDGYVLLMEREPGDPKGWFGALKATLGIRAVNAAKIVKRLCQVNRPALLFGEVHVDHVEIHLVTQVPGYSQEESEILLDGGIVFNRAWLEFAMKNARLKGLANPELLDKAAKWTNFNARWFMPDRVLPVAVKGKNLLKGQGFVVDDLSQPAEDDCEKFRIYVHPGNFKKGLKISGDVVRFILEPQYSKGKDRTNIQYIVNQPHIFPADQVGAWFEGELERKLERILSGQVEQDCLEEYLEFLEVADDNYKNEFDKDGHSSRVRRMIGEWVSAGRKVTEMPSLAKHVFPANLNSMWNEKKCHIRTRIPGAGKEQLICEAMAKRIDPQFRGVGDGKIVAWAKYGMHVVSNRTYLEMRENHGGPDQDDFYTFVYRRVPGETGLGCFVLRCPNEDGNYDYLELQGSPPRWLYQDEILETTPRSKWPKQKKAMPEVVSDFPKANAATNEPLRQGQQCEYSEKEYMETCIGPNTNPGGYIIASQLAVLGGFGGRRRKLGFEDAVDACTQGGTAEQIAYVQKKAVEVGRWVARNGKGLPPCYYSCLMAEARKDERGEWINADQDPRHWFNQLHLRCKRAANKFLAAVQKYILTNGTQPPELVEYTPEKDKEMWHRGVRLYNKLLSIRSRRGGEKSKADWEATRSECREEIAQVKNLMEMVPWLAARCYLGTANGNKADFLLYDCGPELWAAWVEWARKSGGDGPEQGGPETPPSPSSDLTYDGSEKSQDPEAIDYLIEGGSLKIWRVQKPDRVVEVQKIVMKDGRVDLWIKNSKQYVRLSAEEAREMLLQLEWDGEQPQFKWGKG